MPTTEIAVAELLDEFSFEQTYHAVPASLAALRARDAVMLVQDDSCEDVVTLERGRALKLWNPEVHGADHPTVAFQGTLAEAVARAGAGERFFRVGARTSRSYSPSPSSLPRSRRP